MGKLRLGRFKWLPRSGPVEEACCQPQICLFSKPVLLSVVTETCEAARSKEGPNWTWARKGGRKDHERVPSSPPPAHTMPGPRLFHNRTSFLLRWRSLCTHCREKLCQRVKQWGGVGGRKMLRKLCEEKAFIKCKILGPINPICGSDNKSSLFDKIL